MLQILTDTLVSLAERPPASRIALSLEVREVNPAVRSQSSVVSCRLTFMQSPAGTLPFYGLNVLVRVPVAVAPLYGEIHEVCCKGSNSQCRSALFTPIARRMSAVEFRVRTVGCPRNLCGH
jgi:hypothetical protein